MTTGRYSPPRVVRVLSTIQILFRNQGTNATSMCKVDMRRLNSKLEKLQQEGMWIMGVFMTDVDKDPQALAVTVSHDSSLC